MIQYQILQIDIIRTVWQTVGRITNEILGVKGLRQTFVHIKALVRIIIHGMFLITLHIITHVNFMCMSKVCEECFKIMLTVLLLHMYMPFSYV